jgi:tetratricopeptide (TPR) repeat protein
MTALIRPICIICVPFICVLITAFCLYKHYPVYQAYKQWNRHRMFYQVGMYREAAQNYEPLYPYLNDQIKFLFEYGRSLSQWGMNDSKGIAGQARNDINEVRHNRLIKSNEVLQRAMQISCDPMLYNIMGKNHQAMKEYDLAKKCLLKSTQIVPNHLYPWYPLMKLYIEMGDEEKARETAGIVLTKEPKVQSTAVKEMGEEAGKLRTKR